MRFTNSLSNGDMVAADRPEHAKENQQSSGCLGHQKTPFLKQIASTAASGWKVTSEKRKKKTPLSLSLSLCFSQSFSLSSLNLSLYHPSCSWCLGFKKDLPFVVHQGFCLGESVWALMFCERCDVVGLLVCHCWMHAGEAVVKSCFIAVFLQQECVHIYVTIIYLKWLFKQSCFLLKMYSCSVFSSFFMNFSYELFL